MNTPSDLQSARLHVMSFKCPSTISSFSWRSAQHTALLVWRAHFSGQPFRGSINYCPHAFYDMIRDGQGRLIVSSARIRRYAAA